MIKRIEATINNIRNENARPEEITITNEQYADLTSRVDIYLADTPNEMATVRIFGIPYKIGEVFSIRDSRGKLWG